MSYYGINILNAGLFVLAAIALLGSPGPGIAALVAVGREKGFAQGMKFYTGLQIGLALAAGISAVGLLFMVQPLEGLMTAMMVLATAYLVYLAYAIATAPVGENGKAASRLGTGATSGLMLGITNPKAYIAFVSLMAAYPIVRSNSYADLTFKLLACIIVMIVVDILWLGLGAALHRARLQPKSERALNIVMGATILITAALSFL
ncbi:LysE family transporter [Phyllobacterium sp. YR531]|uniref:LysE family translocator n=1 Tax=Phyllobacterium sp. YR531 TaxID=1144343 RepID=UPI00026F7563|nr:LysE family transporter [Phyllobacterium sp. YR531]EJN04584.1 putative threonine efflux protein [Phyllobacterium sp. YR531]